uniref:Uncharacterized protein n=1 Tax=Asparagus officinalis TaxID=4686 RepID=Q2AA55_ASPOF|nr:hypothetical protein 19.t00008 [Asparagus officinalis]
MLTQTSSTLNSFMQSTGQMLNSNTQAIARLESQLGQLASASGRQVDNQVRTPPSQTFDLIQIPSPSPSDESIQQSPPLDDQEPEPEPEPVFDRFRPVAPFLDRLRPRKHSLQEEKILETFKQVNVNIPLLDKQRLATLKEGVASHIIFSGVPPPIVLIMPIEEVILMIILSQPFVDRDTEQEAWLCKNKKDVGH